MGLYQISFMRKAKHHVVKETVEYAKVALGEKVGKFVNAILRRFIRDLEGANISRPGVTPTSQEATPRLLSINHSFPEWLVERWLARYGVLQTQNLLTSLNRPPEFTLRINLEKVQKKDVIRTIEDMGVKVRPGVFLDSALHVDRLAPVLADPLFRQKLVQVQDESSQLAGLALSARPGDLVLDACAGQGTKTTQIMEGPRDIRVIAMDTDAGRLRSIRPPIPAIRADALHAPFREETFDIILLDAPCSSIGVIRKHPEIRWRRKESDIRRFGDQQFKMLKALWKQLKVGGYFVYSVCTFEPEETVDILDRFSRETKFVLENPLPFLFNKEYFISLPDESGMDGFFIARLKKL
jgi:16S rRNA (cytosine967-C5)-methyltransferase